MSESLLANAIRYSSNHWKALAMILRSDCACIDNSAAERAIRPAILGRCNLTLAGSDADVVRAAASYSLIETAKIRGLRSRSVSELRHSAYR